MTKISKEVLEFNENAPYIVDEFQPIRFFHPMKIEDGIITIKKETISKREDIWEFLDDKKFVSFEYAFSFFQEEEEMMGVWISDIKENKKIPSMLHFEGARSSSDIEFKCTLDAMLWKSWMKIESNIKSDDILYDEENNSFYSKKRKFYFTLSEFIDGNYAVFVIIGSTISNNKVRISKDKKPTKIENQGVPISIENLKIKIYEKFYETYKKIHNVKKNCKTGDGLEREQQQVLQHD